MKKLRRHRAQPLTPIPLLKPLNAGNPAVLKQGERELAAQIDAGVDQQPSSLDEKSADADVDELAALRPVLAEMEAIRNMKRTSHKKSEDGDDDGDDGKQARWL